MAKDGVPEKVDEQDTIEMSTAIYDTDGVVLDVVEDVPTRKVIVGRFAFNEKCRCGAVVTIDDESVLRLVVYDARTFELLGCPVCVPSDELVPVYRKRTLQTLRIVKGG